MSSNKRVIWSEGLFLRPQHFQQHDRYFERYTELRAGYLRPNGWGFVQLELEVDQLAIGRLAVRRARGVFPDGTPFSMPDDDPVPPAIEVGADVRNKTAYLALPMRKAGATDFVRTPGTGYSRFTVGATEAYDATGDSTEAAALDVGDLAARILIEGEPLADFACIPLAHIVERANGRLLLDDNFIPTVLRAGAAPPLARFLQELQGLLRQRGDEYALYAMGAGKNAASQVSDYLYLQICNRYQPIVTHWGGPADVHPEDLYTAALGLAGELATYTSESRRPPAFPSYEHTRLRTAYDRLIQALRNALSGKTVRAAVEIPLTSLPEHGMWHGFIADRTLVDSAAFVLAVRADVPDREIRERFPLQSKVASAHEIRRYIMEMVPALGLKVRSQPPGQIPYLADAVYFDIDTRGPLWNAVRKEGEISIHVGGKFPGIVLALWAIRG